MATLKTIGPIINSQPLNDNFNAINDEVAAHKADNAAHGVYIANPGYSVDGTDADTYDWKTGFYMVGPNMANMPYNASYWFVKCLKEASVSRTLVAFNADRINFYVRVQSSGVWGQWQKLWHSGNDGDGSGLDADTVDGVQGVNLAKTKAETTPANLNNNTTYESGFYTVSNGNALGLSAYWHHIINMKHFDQNGYNAQISVPLNQVGGDIKYRTSSGGIWSAWRKIWTEINANLYQGTGSPEGVVTVPVGAIYQRLDGGAGTTFYVRESGTGNVGWVAK